jgi:acyl-CoA thioesterase FadM/ketosteroid isomerase-like protein
MSRDAAADIYAGDDRQSVEDLLADDVVWHVPGSNPIAGDYRGKDAVLGYFRRLRSLTGATVRISEAGQVHHDDALVHLTDCAAQLGGRNVLWRTASAYRIANGRIAEAWLVPLDQQHSDQTLAATRPAPYVYVHRVRPQECAASTMLGHPRFLDVFEAAFIECWRDRFGAVDATLGPNRRLTVAAVNVRYLGPVRSDEALRIEVVFDRISQRSIHVHYNAFVDARQVAEAGSHYVCIDAESGSAAALPDEIVDEGVGSPGFALMSLPRGAGL